MPQCAWWMCPLATLRVRYNGTPMVLLSLPTMCTLVYTSCCWRQREASSLAQVASRVECWLAQTS